MNYDEVTADMIDKVIRRQCSAEIDRAHFAQVLGESKEFMEYVFMLAKQTRIKGPQHVPDAMASALTLGIEIGVALEKFNNERTGVH